MPNFYYQQNGQTHGPVTSSQLKELARSGNLGPDDLVRSDDTEKWAKASKFKNLIRPTDPLAKPADGTPAVVVPQGPTEVGGTNPFDFDAPVAFPSAVPPASAPAETPPANAPNPIPAPSIKDRLSEGMAKYKPIAQRYADEFGLSLNRFLMGSVGVGCLLVLALGTFLTWEYHATVTGKMSDEYTSQGLEIFEGKFVCLASVVGIGSLVTSFFMRKLLPASLLIAAAAATLSIFLTYSYRHQINRTQAEINRVEKALVDNMVKQEGADANGRKNLEEMFGHETHQSGWGLYFSLVASLAAAPLLIAPALVKPITLPFLQKESIHPSARKHGALLISQAAAILLGLALYILRY